jgi:hypothetical protein
VASYFEQRGISANRLTRISVFQVDYQLDRMIERP